MSTNTTVRRRSDARQNAQRILQAAIACFGRSATATMQDIAVEAGLGRVTVYAHFSSRAVLVERALATAIERGDVLIEADVDADAEDDPIGALRRLVEASWALSAASANLWAAAVEELGAARVRELHGRPAERAERLLRRGQQTGAFRADLDPAWFVGSLHALMKFALEEVSHDRLRTDHAAELITTSTLALWRA